MAATVATPTKPHAQTLKRSVSLEDNKPGGVAPTSGKGSSLERSPSQAEVTPGGKTSQGKSGEEAKGGKKRRKVNHGQSSNHETIRGARLRGCLGSMRVLSKIGKFPWNL